MDEFCAAVSACDYSIICLVETWLSRDILNSEYFSLDFNVVRCDRKFETLGLSRGGGVLMAYKNCLKVDTLDVSIIMNNIPKIDIVGCKLQLHSRSIFLYTVYIPPDVSALEFELFLDLLENMISTLDNIIILGDFNVPNFINIANNDTKSHLLQNFLNINNLNQINNIVNSNGRLLDLVIGNIDCDIVREIFPIVKEDLHHPPLCVNMSLANNDPTNFPCNADSRKHYNFQKANFHCLYNSIMLTDWSFLNIFTDVNLACDKFYEKLTSIFDQHVPLFHNKKCKYPTWYTYEIIRINNSNNINNVEKHDLKKITTNLFKSKLF